MGTAVLHPFGFIVSMNESDDVALTKFLGILEMCRLDPFLLPARKQWAMRASYIAIVTQIKQTPGVNMYVHLHFTMELFLAF